MLFSRPVELGSLELTGAQPNCLGFVARRACFELFNGDVWNVENLTFVYACIGRKPFRVLIVLSLFNEWVGFAHLRSGGWVVNTSCTVNPRCILPVDVTICFKRRVNYCKQRKPRCRNSRALSETGVCPVIGCSATVRFVFQHTTVADRTPALSPSPSRSAVRHAWNSPSGQTSSPAPVRGRRAPETPRLT